MEDAWIEVISDMRKRREFGIQERGKPVVPHDEQENWLQHAYEEALDLAVYLKAQIIKNKNVT